MEFTSQQLNDAIRRIQAGGASYWDSNDPEDGPADALLVVRALAVCRDALREACEDSGDCPECRSPMYHRHDPGCKVAELIGVDVATKGGG